MEADFFRESIAVSDMVMEMTLNKGCQIFEEKYQRVLANANEQGHQMIHSIVRGSELKPQRSKEIPQDCEPKKFAKDNMGSFEARIERRARSTMRTAGGPRNRRSRQTPSQQLSSPRSKSNSRARSRSRGDKLNALVKINPQIIPTAEELKRVEMEDRLRRLRDSRINCEREKDLADKIRQEKNASELVELTKQKMQLDKKRLVYTFDFEGKVLLCEAVNKHRRLIGDDLYVEISGEVQPVKEQKQPEDPSSLAQLRNDAAKGDIFRSMLDMGRIHNPQSNALLRNEQYNNNNMRQVSSIPLMELVDGVKINEHQNLAELSCQRKPFLSKLKFLESIRNRRFVRTYGTGLIESRAPKVDQINLNPRAGAVSVMVGSHHELSPQKPLPNSDEEEAEQKSKFTSSTGMNRTRNKQRVSQYGDTAYSGLFGTSQQFRPNIEPESEAPRRRRNNHGRIQVHNNLVSALIN